ncbi:MAG: nicotinate-nucleotide adenylyltransferase [Bacteroidia bacterium]|nr:nicotinate-nucleotide adenylyltransferase [Bacteroidia bacterium]
MKTGLFFGSFNPIHIGHLAIANYMLEFTDLDKIWFVISPHNPMKDKSTLLADHHRYELVNRAIGDNSKMKASNIEFKLPKPSYTVHTLAYLKEKYPETDFVLIIGTDSMNSFHKWKNYEAILQEHEVYVYPRLGTEENPKADIKKFKRINAPVIEISSSFIREAIKAGKDVRYFLPEKAFKYLDEMNFYKNLNFKH